MRCGRFFLRYRYESGKAERATEELGEVVCPNNNESLREKFFKNLFQNLSK